jgi:hypothetical protein
MRTELTSSIQQMSDSEKRKGAKKKELQELKSEWKTVLRAAGAKMVERVSRLY